MKLILLALFTLVLSSESFAQHRGSRGGRNGGGRIGGSVRIGGVRIGVELGNRGHRPGRINRRGPVYRDNRYDNRYGNGYGNGTGYGNGYGNGRGNGYGTASYSCNYDSLYYNNQFIHSLNYSSCNQAINDVSRFGYFCDGTTMYRSNGSYDYQYNSVYNCRQALDD